MTTPIPIQFATQFAPSVSPPLSSERLINMYLEASPRSAKNPVVLLGTPGLTLFAALSTGPVRGIHKMNGYVWAVAGDRIYRVSETAGIEDKGEVAGSGNVRMAENGTHLWVATEDKLYAVNESQILELPESNMVGVAYQDGWLIGAQGGGQFFWLSNLDDATTIDGLSFSSADAFSDYNVGCIMANRELFLFKERSTEIWYNSGAAGFAFARQGGGVIERGALAGDSIAKANNTIYFLGDDRQVYALRGYQPQVISTEAVTRLIESVNSPQTAVGFCYQAHGHTHYALTFSSATLVYDTNTGLWHQRQSFGLDRWRPSCAVYMDRWKKTILGDCENGNLYELDPLAYTENGSVLQRRMTGVPLFWQGRRAIIDELFVDIEAGVGPESGTAPQIMLDWSEDGVVWSNELWRSFGKIGERTVRAVWRNLGAHRLFIPRLTITDSVPVRIAGVFARIRELSV